MTTISKYQVVWVEIKATTGIVTKIDRKAMGRDIMLRGKSSVSEYYHFPTKEKAIEWLNTMQSTQLSKVYACRIFSDAQFAKRDRANNFAVPFTSKQLNEVYYI